MLIENLMYFALGVLAAGLVALIIMPAVWKRAVRLTKRRIEAATPITLAEFRADKDQLRAEFALTTRRLEMNVEALRQRLAEQMSAASQKSTDLGALQIEREKHLGIVREFEKREIDMRARIIELEKETTDLAQRLRMREREAETRRTEMDALRSGGNSEPMAAAVPQDLEDAEARMASAENQLNALLAETDGPAKGPDGTRDDRLLADRLGLEDEVEKLRVSVMDVQSAILSGWDSNTLDRGALRAQLNAIATSVSRLVYAPEPQAATAAPEEESLFARVQRFADDGESEDVIEHQPAQPRGGTLADRLAAVQEIQGR